MITALFWLALLGFVVLVFFSGLPAYKVDVRRKTEERRRKRR